MADDAREQWAYAEVAQYLGVQPTTVASYRKRGQMPEPDGQLGGRWWWWSDTITAWAATRRPITNRARMSH